MLVQEPLEHLFGLAELLFAGGNRPALLGRLDQGDPCFQIDRLLEFLVGQGAGAHLLQIFQRHVVIACAAQGIEESLRFFRGAEFGSHKPGAQHTAGEDGSPQPLLCSVFL